MFFFSLDDDYLQNASTILDKLKSFYRQGGETSSLPKLLQDYTQVNTRISLDYPSCLITVIYKRCVEFVYEYYGFQN